MKMNTERNTQVLLAHINNGAKIEVARIGADESNGEQAYLSEESMAQSMEHPLKPLADAISQGGAPLRSLVYLPIGVAFVVAYAYAASDNFGKISKYFSIE
jgi:hypothetical protein